MLNTDDYRAIETLYARYCACFDLGNVEGWLACWTEDALFIGAEENRGQAQLKTFIEKRIKARAEAPNKNVQHWNSGLIVEGDGNSAKGMCYILLVGKRKETNEVVMVTQGTYVDELSKTGGKWRFSKRHMSQEPPSPDKIPQPG